MRKFRIWKYITIIALLVTLFVNTVIVWTASAQEADQKVVRVGWYESTFCYRDQFGRRCGIDYEYQRKISVYTGWTFEYVEDSWSNLLQMLIDGEIDLLSDVSYTQERTRLMLFPDLPMGTETYYIYIDSDNREITSKELSSFNGKRIGVNQGSVQEGFLREWADKNKISLEVVPLSTEEAESMEMLAHGEIDGYASTNTFGAKEAVVPVCRIGSSDFYYGVNKRRPDLLAELNMALSEIQNEDPYYNERMSQEHLFTTNTNAFLTPDQEDWLTQHGTIRIGYQDNYLPFCQADPVTGELTGALRDYLAHAENSLKNSNIHFEAVPYPSAAAALADMETGQIDCVFPVSLSSYDAAEMGIQLTNPAMVTEMNAVMRALGQQGISSDTTFAVCDGDINTETFVKDHFPDCEIIPYPDSRACYEAVASQDVECVLESSYRDVEAEDLLKKYKLFSVPTGESMALSFAVDQADRELYFILNKTVVMTTSEDMVTALASYSQFSRKVSFSQFMEENWFYVIAFICVVFAIIIVLLRQKQKAERKANEQQRLLAEAEEIKELEQTITSLLDNMPGMSYTKDAETGAYLACNQAFADYAQKASPDDVTGLTDQELFDQETVAHFERDDRMALSMNKPYIFYEDVLDGAGRQRQFQTTKLKYTDFSGRQCILGMSQDVTDMVRIPRENSQTREAYESARSVGILYTHIAKTLARDYTDMFYVNLDTEEFIEYSKTDENSALSETRRGWHFFSDCKAELSNSVYPDDRDAFLAAMDRRTLMKTLEHKNTFVITYRQMGDNEPFYVSLKVSLMEDDEHFIIVGITNVDAQMRDTIAKNMALAEAIASAEQANIEKTSFLSGMSHELRTPLNAIIGLDLLALRDESLDTQTRDYLQKMGTSARNLLDLLDNVLEMSRIESGSMILLQEAFSFTAMLEQINALIMSQCNEKNIDFESRILNQVDVSYIGDETKLKEVLVNILSDSVRHTKTSGSVTFCVKQAEKYEDQSILCFGIRNTGIDKDYVDRIVEALSKAGSSESRYSSIGLKVAITKQIVEMMNGSIDIEFQKEDEFGVTVTVMLRNGDQAADRETAIDPNALYVLVVDDDRIASEHAKMVLEEVGIRADLCTSGEEALHMIEAGYTRNDPYNLVLMDWSMPGMSGMEASAQIRQRYGNEITIVVLTAYSWDDIREEASRVGVNNFLAKPLNAGNILGEFERIARRNHLDLFMEKPRASLAGRRVLLAEDVEVNAQIMIDLLDMERIETDHAINGKIAVQMFEQHPAGTYDAILMDMRMPQMDGLEAARVIRAMDRDDAKRIPIIALTANAFDTDVQMSLKAGMNAHLSKPVDLDELIRILGELIYEAES